MPAAKKQWITKLEAARRLEIHPETFLKMVRAGLVTHRKLPLARQLYLASDVAAIAAAAVVPRTTKAAQRPKPRAACARAS